MIDARTEDEVKAKEMKNAGGTFIHGEPVGDVTKKVSS
jgi:hypothetical protein